MVLISRWYTYMSFKQPKQSVCSYGINNTGMCEMAYIDAQYTISWLVRFVFSYTGTSVTSGKGDYHWDFNLYRKCTSYGYVYHKNLIKLSITNLIMCESTTYNPSVFYNTLLCKIKCIKAKEVVYTTSDGKYNISMC